ncbi:TonB-dependent receptor [Telluribacter sp.]|uniref:SusC/RagA family TonB-linked outer membrane protein n=1 Tax=Telluribacter sp. TaxID=1978767 RepID=UPI002E0F454E|nr:TonB-dependent receptor [Telluribacter sp.]
MKQLLHRASGLGLILTVILMGQQPGFAQSVAMARNLQEVPQQATKAASLKLKDVLNDLKNLYQVDILFELKVVDGLTAPANSINKSQDLEKNLERLLKPSGLQYKKVNKSSYLITETRKTTNKAEADARFQEGTTETDEKALGGTSRRGVTADGRNLNAPGISAAVERNVTGTVRDEAGASLPGVSVVLKGTQRGTTTDADGKFSLAVPDNGATLIFSFVGYAPQEVPVGNQSVLDIRMQSDERALEELVVVGYGTQKKSDLTGSVSSLRDKDFNPGANASVDQMMLGRSAGVQINQTSSEPGGGVSIRIRGANSLNAGSEPLYVIDGLPIDNGSLLSASSGGAGTGTNNNPRNPLNSINPNDIASIEILKDASATAIYGSRGANGVILITTKKGNKGKIGVNYDFNTGIQTVPNKLDVLNTSQYIQFMNDLAKDEGKAPVFTAADIAQIGAGTDWQDQVYQKAPLNSHNISVSGGDDKTTFFSSLNYFNQEGVVKRSGIKKYIARVNLERKLGERAVIGVNINTSLVKDANSIDGVNNNENAGPINSALLYDPTEPIFAGDGRFSQSKNLTINNPVSLIEGLSSTNATNRTMGSIFVKYTILPGLDAKLNFGSDRQTSRRDLFNSTKTLNGLSAKGIANIATLERSNVLMEYTMNYNRQLNEKSTLNLLGGVTYQYFNNRSFSGIIRGFPSDALSTNNLGLGDTNLDNLFSGQEDNSILSYLSRVNYTLNDKYLFTASLRADGSSRFGANNKFGYFPSVALGWRLSEEGFLPSFFYDLKLRASWGLTGNQEINNYASLTTYTTGATAVFNNAVNVGTRPSRIANPDLKWESTEQTNIGIDASILQGRISATVDYFIKNTRDMLIDLPLPRATGFNSILSNVGKMQNKGVEVMLTSTNVKKGQFSWSTTLNFAAIRNKITDLGDVTNIITGSIESIGPTSIVTVGYPAFSYYGYEVTGLFQQGDNIAGSAQPGSKPGYPIFRDVNGDNKITPLDQQIIGNPFPDFTFGISNNVTYKRFQLDFFFQGQQGADMLNINVLESMYPNNARRNRITEQVLDRWTPQNPTAKWPSGVQPTAYGAGKVTTLALQDASYIRLRNLSVGYNLPVEKLKFIQSARVYVVGQNLATFTNYIGFDPEANAFGRSNVRVDYNGYPLARTWMLGVNVGF